ncbi:MAG TPA: hypothetical protein PKA00_16060 [Saprospiraceae bacterium]|nr:hypothetical protein [Saprospiraceae bacterium]HMQ84430.1 hypothetical protein [Saprospiraceae bacterium]
MKNYLIVLAVCGLFMAAKCSKGHGYELGQSFTLQIGEKATCKCGGKTVQFTAVKEDSRCPEYTNCVWEGQAVIQLSVENEKLEYIDLTLREGHDEMASQTVGGFTYRLKKVSPYPKAGQKINPEEYIIEMVVEAI